MQDKLTILVPLNKGQFALIDPEDAENILKHNWYLHAGGYACRSRQRGEDTPGGRTILMHRQVMGFPERGFHVDHVSGAKLDNRRSNLRVGTCSQNLINRGPNRNNSSGFKGVYWQPQSQWWFSQIMIDRKSKYLGHFDCPEDAAHAYDKAAKELFGDVAYLNFPDHN